MNTSSKHNGFTLVELIVTMSILSILSTVGMLAYFGYAGDSRDSVRISELRNIEQVLELYSIDNSSFPTPDNASNINIDGTTLWQQGTFGDTVFRSVKRLSEKPLDPLLGIEYSYSLLNDKQEYEISTIFEGNQISYIPGISSAYAAEIKAYSAGNYNKRIVYVDGGSTDTILALASITSSDEISQDIFEIIDRNNLVIHGKSNLPKNYNVVKYQQSGGVQSELENLVVFSGDISQLDTFSGQQDFIKNLQRSYAHSEHMSSQDTEIYKKIQNIDTNNPEVLHAYIDFLSENRIGGLPKM